jgi:hypothetical protein
MNRGGEGVALGRRSFLSVVLSLICYAVVGFRRRRVGGGNRVAEGGREALYYEREGKGR